MKRKMWLLTVALAVGCLLPTAAMAESADVTLNVNHEQVAVDENTGTPYIGDNGRTMVPLRVVNDYLDYTTDWTSDGKIHITGKDGTVDVTVQAGSTDYTANGEAGQFETAPVIREDGRTYLPARDFGELYGSVYWDGVGRTVWIYDGDVPSYKIFRSGLVRADADGMTVMAMPEGYEVMQDTKPDIVQRQETCEGKNYITINYRNNHANQCPVFRDDGSRMTRVAETMVNGSSSFVVDGDTLYHTMGTDAGPWTNGIVPELLYVTTLGTDETTVSVTLDFAVNECDLSIEDGNLIATAPDGTRHVVELATLVPDEK